MLGIIIACGILLLAVVMVIVIVDIRRLRVNTKQLREELERIHSKLDALQSHM